MDILRNDRDDGAGEVGLPPPQDGIGDDDIDELADLIGRVTITEPEEVVVPPVAQPAVRQLNRPTALTEENLPLTLARSQIQTESQTLAVLGRMLTLVTAGNENRADLADDARVNFDHIIQGMGHIHNNLVQKQQLLAGANRRARQFRSTLDTPVYVPRAHGEARDPRMLSGKNIKDNTPVFNPKVTGADFRVTWHRLKDYGTLYHFEENDYLLALGHVLEEKAYLEYVQLRQNNATLRDILDHLGETYVPKQSIYEDQLAVDKFFRTRKEPLQKAMRRALMCVEKLKSAHQENEWPILLKKHMEDILYKIVTPSTQRLIRKLVEVYTESGLAYDLPTLIHKADMHEVTNDAAPTTEMPIQSFPVNVSKVHFKDEAEKDRASRPEQKPYSRQNSYRSKERSADRNNSQSRDRRYSRSRSPRSNYPAKSQSQGPYQNRYRSQSPTSSNYSKSNNRYGRSQSPNYRQANNYDRSKSPSYNKDQNQNRNRDRSNSANRHVTPSRQQQSKNDEKAFKIDNTNFYKCSYCPSLHSSQDDCAIYRQSKGKSP